MKFSKHDMLEMLDGYNKEFPLKLIEDKIVNHSRWAVGHEIVFKDEDTNKHYSAYYRVGATESQEESPWQYDGDEIESEEVKQVEKTIKVWEKI